MRIPVAPAAHSPFHQTQPAFNAEVVECLRQLAFPQGPVRVWRVAQAELPPAYDWQDHAVFVTELNVLAVSNGESWIRQDTGTEITDA